MYVLKVKLQSIQNKNNNKQFKDSSAVVSYAVVSGSLCPSKSRSLWNFKEVGIIVHSYTDFCLSLVMILIS